jgi:hypothetical protein
MINISTTPILDETRAGMIAANIHSQHAELAVPLHEHIEATLAKYKKDPAARDQALQKLFAKNPEKLAGFHPHDHLSEKTKSEYEDHKYGMRDETFATEEFAKFFTSDMCLAQFEKILNRILEEAELRPHDTAERLESLDRAVAKMHSMAHIASHMGLAVHPDISQTMYDLRGKIQAAQSEHAAKTALVSAKAGTTISMAGFKFDTSRDSALTGDEASATAALAAKASEDATTIGRN